MDPTQLHIGVLAPPGWKMAVCSLPQNEEMQELSDPELLNTHGKDFSTVDII